MPGVQSFVAQRQQSYQNPSRQILGAQNRVPIPVTKLEYTKEKPSFYRSNPTQLVDPHVAERSTQLTRQQSAKVSVVQDDFDTDAEGLDDTTTMSVEGRNWGHQGQVDGGQISSHPGIDFANGIISGTQVLRRGQEHPHHIQEARRLDAEGAGEDSDEGNCRPNFEEDDEEVPEAEKSVRDGILQDLNSPGFFRYLQEETSHTTGAAFQPVITPPVAHTSLALRDSAPQSQKPANPLRTMGNSMNGGIADPDVNLRHQGYECVTNQSSEAPVQEIYGRSLKQLSISTQHRQMYNHHESTQQPSVILHQALQPTRVAKVTVAPYVQPQAKGERPLSAQKGSTDLGDDDSFVDWGSDVDRRHDSGPKAPLNDEQTRKRIRDLDYSPDHISTMTFQQLSNEPFHLASDTARASIPQELLNGSLEEKMGYVSKDLQNHEAKYVHRRVFFSSLSIEEYEECANLIVQKFSAIMSKFTDVRQERRRVSKEFEDEVARREQCVRGKNTVVDQDLGRLKRGGEEVVRGTAL